MTQYARITGKVIRSGGSRLLCVEITKKRSKSGNRPRNAHVTLHFDLEDVRALDDLFDLLEPQP